MNRSPDLRIMAKRPGLPSPLGLSGWCTLHRRPSHSSLTVAGPRGTCTHFPDSSGNVELFIGVYPNPPPAE